MSKKFLATFVGLAIAGGGIAGIPMAAKAMNPLEKVIVQSFAVEKTKVDLGEFKKGTKYCAIKVKHRKTGLTAPVPAPAKTCNILKKGKEITIKAGKFVSI